MEYVKRERCGNCWRDLHDPRFSQLSRDENCGAVDGVDLDDLGVANATETALGKSLSAVVGSDLCAVFLVMERTKCTRQGAKF